MVVARFKINICRNVSLIIYYGRPNVINGIMFHSWCLSLSFVFIEESRMLRCLVLLWANTLIDWLIILSPRFSWNFATRLKIRATLNITSQNLGSFPRKWANQFRFLTTFRQTVSGNVSEKKTIYRQSVDSAAKQRSLSRRRNLVNLVHERGKIAPKFGLKCCNTLANVLAAFRNCFIYRI